MPQYQLQLQDRKSPQRREVLVDAPSEKLAAAIAMQKELKLVNFSLVPTEPVEPREPDSNDAEILVSYLNARETYARDIAVYESRTKEDKAILAKLEKDHGIDKNGKAYGPTKLGRGHLLAHRQDEPFEIVSIELVEPDVEKLVRAVLALQENPAAWKKALAKLKEGGAPFAVVTASIFGLQAQKQLDGSAPIVWSSATEKVALTTSTWTPNQDTHDFFDDVTNEVIGSTGYTTGGATLASKTSTLDTASDQIRLDAGDTSWPSSTITARRAPIYNDTGGAASTDPLQGWVDFGADFSSSNGTFQITWDPTGIFNYDVT